MKTTDKKTVLPFIGGRKLGRLMRNRIIVSAVNMTPMAIADFLPINQEILDKSYDIYAVPLDDFTVRTVYVQDVDGDAMGLLGMDENFHDHGILAIVKDNHFEPASDISYIEEADYQAMISSLEQVNDNTTNSSGYAVS